MDSCFPPLAILGQRELVKFSAINLDGKTTRSQAGGSCRATNANSANGSPKLTERNDLPGKIGTLQDLDLYYVRQLARNSKEHDLERKIELELKMREGSSRLLAAARHPAQSLEAARALFTSNERMSTYMAELQHRKRDATAKPSATGSRGRLSISDLRFPLMWRDSDHFKNRGDHRRFAVFCLVRVGTEIHDTSLLCPVDREQTDISFSDVLIFNNVPAEFELILEIYSHVLQQDLSIASTPRRIRKTIHSSISKTVGKKLAASLRDELDSGKTGPQFDLVARARMTIDDTDSNIHTHDLVVNSFENKYHALPLFGHFCCRLAVQPDCISKEVCAGFLGLNNQPCWARLKNFRIEAWESKKLAEENQDPTYTVSVNKETSIRRPKSTGKQLRIINSLDGIETSDTIVLDSNDDTERWFGQLLGHLSDHSRWKHAAVIVQEVPCIEGANTNARNSFVGNKRQGSLYDETPLIGNSFGEDRIREAFVLPSAPTLEATTARRTRSSTTPIVPLKSHWAFSDKNHNR